MERHLFNLEIFASFVKFLRFIASWFKYTVCMFSVDKKLIQRKRQDTLDMCRIFNEETARLEQYNSGRKFKTNDDHSKQHIRTKRNVDSLNPAVKVEDIRRVEGIVDKLYDDMDVDGKVTYRQRRFDSPTTDKVSFYKTSYM